MPNFLSVSDVDLLKDSMQSRIQEEADRRKNCTDGTVFDPKNPEKHSKDRYFIESGNKVHYFLEEGCTDVSVATVNKVGHALHTDNSVFQQFTKRPVFGSMLRQLGWEHPSVVQSMYILKPPHIGGEVSPHQDSTWINSAPHSCIGVWFALDDCVVNNGCLMIKYGSQDQVPLSAHCKLNDGRDDSTLHGTLPNCPLDEMTPVECPKGSMLLFGGQTIHASAPNKSPNKRHAFVFHVVDDACSWNEKNWLNPYLSRLAL